MAIVPFPCAAAPLTADQFESTLAALGADAASIWALLEVESGKAGYLPDRRPQILFERAVFHQRTHGVYDQSHPGISAPTWGGYSGGAAEYTRLAEAYALSPDDALQSASWGIAQIMGFNFAESGFASPSDFVQAACTSEGAQLQAFQTFLINSGIAASLAAHDWDAVARKYNGPGQVAVYSGRLQQNYARLSEPASLPDLDVRTVQLYLSFAAHAQCNSAFNPGGIDGILGMPGNSRTLTALSAYNAAHGLPAADSVDGSVIAAVAATMPSATPLSLA
jgi:hypothetical protein